MFQRRGLSGIFLITNLLVFVFINAIAETDGVETPHSMELYPEEGRALLNSSTEGGSMIHIGAGLEQVAVPFLARNVVGKYTGAERVSLHLRLLNNETFSVGLTATVYFDLQSDHTYEVRVDFPTIDVAPGEIRNVVVNSTSFSATPGDMRWGVVELVFRINREENASLYLITDNETYISIPYEPQVPVAVAGNDKRAFVGEAVSFNASSSYDPNDDPLTYYWDFNASDGLGWDAEGVAVTHIFNESGTYIVTLNVSDGRYWSHDTLVVEVAEQNPPVPIINASSTYVGRGDVITFNASLSYDPDGDNLTFWWDFGDGTVAEGIVVTHSYQRGGRYNVTLNVSDGYHNVSTTLTVTVIKNRPPEVNAGEDRRVLIGETVRFEGNGTDPDGDRILLYTWDFGDGDLAYGQVVEHRYNCTGMFIVTLTAFDGMDNGTDWVSVEVLPNSPPVAEGGEDIYSYNLTVTLSAAESKDPENHTLTYEWNLGDGTTATGVNVTHTYPTYGKYHVVLTVRDPYGGVSQDEFNVYILNYTIFHPIQITVDGRYDSVDGVEKGEIKVRKWTSSGGSEYYYYYSESEGYRIYELNFPRRTEVGIHLTVINGTFIDVLLLDQENLDRYTLYWVGGEPIYAEHLWLKTMEVHVSIPVEGRLYLVVDNNNILKNGAYPIDVVYYRLEITPENSNKNGSDGEHTGDEGGGDGEAGTSTQNYALLKAVFIGLAVIIGGTILFAFLFIKWLSRGEATPPPVSTSQNINRE
ncbi:MAG: PKD domain-containing protein, partial [Thermoplasmata archaeon]|nr:PKD domain-containing protein [Thermoplasmata archaeon]